MGLCKEIVIDRTLAGQSLEDNIVVIAACNPARKRSSTGMNPRERDLGREWAGVHYQVAELPHSIAKIKWSFGSLNHDQEKEFILRRLEIAGGETVPLHLQIALTEFISESHEAMRTFAARNIRDSLVRETGEIGEKIDILASTRARSVVSLRDIQRVFALFDFFSSSLQIPCIVEAPGYQRQRRSMLLAIATVYFLRLDSVSRAKFLEMTRTLSAEQGDKCDLQWILNQAMDEVIDDTEIPEGIAVTRGVKENVFMTFVCTLSGTPLIIVGPPGSSKVSHSCVNCFSRGLDI
jgi:hemicentin